MGNLESYLSDKTVAYYERLGNRGMFAYEKQIVQKYFKPNTKVLDIGCGTGRTTVELNKRGYQVVGIDSSRKMIDAAKLADPDILYTVQNVMTMNFPDRYFDNAIFSFNGLMLMTTFNNREKALKEIARVLRNGGLFFFTTPFINNKIDSEYWSDKIQSYNKNINDFTWNEKLSLGDEITEEEDVKFFIHVPFTEEIEYMLSKNGFVIELACRRLDRYEAEEIEDELDDNYIWVARNENL